ncbi:hypothetical protein DFS34DRAFT_57543 [Phlyctochytrium arcticum]|nr:hypothetical protein DFS34DRAFT_57543 [Phlyctochytrium arcticum]
MFSTYFYKMSHDCAVRAAERKGTAAICDLTDEDWIALWKDQAGCCYYTGIAMSHAPASDWRASPERLDNDLGYVAGNCVLIISELNVRAHWSHLKITDMVQMLLGLVDGAAAHDKMVQQLPISALDEFMRMVLRRAEHGVTKRAAFRNLTCDLTIDKLTDMFVAQNGRCLYSGLLEYH